MNDRDRVLLAVIGLSLVLQGCAGGLTIGASEPNCKPTYGGVCASPSEVYAMTNGHGDGASEEQATEDGSVPATAPGEAQRFKREAPRSEPPLMRVANGEPRADKPVPVRTPALVMRIWIGAWEDTTGVLHAPAYAFNEIEDRRWAIGGRNQVQPVRLISIQDDVPVRADLGGDPPRPSGTEPVTVGLNQ